jgi:hypothetical protein
MQSMQESKASVAGAKNKDLRGAARVAKGEAEVEIVAASAEIKAVTVTPTPASAEDETFEADDVVERVERALELQFVSRLLPLT